MKYFQVLALSIKRVIIFLGSILLAIVVYAILLPDNWRTGGVLFSVMALWFFSAYFVLPLVHRTLSRLYVPNYFFGRTMSADGLLSDPVNLAVNGSKRDFRRAMKRAGWHEADDLSLNSIIKAFFAILWRRDYPKAPVTRLFLFGRKQDLAFEIQVDGNPRKRHHVRFWKAPSGWYLPGGYKVDWLGAATYDSAVGLSFFTSQLTHHIDPNIDQERDFVIESLNKVHTDLEIQKIDHYFPPFQSRNGSGGKLLTDGSLVIATLKSKPQ